MIYKTNQAITEEILVLNSTGTAVTGLTNGDFTSTLLKNKGATGESITVSEKGNGYYYVDFTPTSTGIYSWKVTHATYEPNGWYDYYRVVAQDTVDNYTAIGNNNTAIGSNYTAIIANGVAIGSIQTDTTAIISSLADHETYLLRLLGLVQENTYMDNIVYTDSNVTSARIRTYDAAASVGSGSDIVATYTMTSTYNASNQLTSYKVVKQ